MKRLHVLFLGIFCLLAPSACRTADVTRPVVEGVRYPPIVMYMKHSCPYCRKAEEYFTARRIPFTTRDIATDVAALREFRERYHGEIVPLIVFGNDERVIDGYDLPAIRKALRAFGLPADD